MIQLYTDGSTRKNGESGLAYVIVDGGKVKAESLFCRLSTPIRMEMLAIILGLNKINPKSKSRVYTDCKSIVEGMASNTEKKANCDLWKSLARAVSKYESVDFVWIKSKSGNLYHSMADDLAFGSNRAEKSFIDHEYEKTESHVPPLGTWRPGDP